MGKEWSQGLKNLMEVRIYLSVTMCDLRSGLMSRMAGQERAPIEVVKGGLEAKRGGKGRSALPRDWWNGSKP